MAGLGAPEDAGFDIDQVSFVRLDPSEHEITDFAWALEQKEILFRLVILHAKGGAVVFYERCGFVLSESRSLRLGRYDLSQDQHSARPLRPGCFIAFARRTKNRLWVGPVMENGPGLALVVAIVLLGPAVAGCLGSTNEDGTSPDDGDVPGVGDEDATESVDLNVSSSRFGSTASASNFEPTVAAGPEGTVYVTGGNAPAIHVTTDSGETWERRPAPPPSGTEPRLLAGDALVQVDTEGRLWYIALLSSPTYPGPVAEGVQIAVSGDRGQTWSANHYIGPPDGPTPADRPWIAFGPDGIAHITWKTLGPQYLTGVSSTDGGQSLSEPVNVTPEQSSGNTLIGGQPSVTSDGTLMVPYLRFTEADESLQIARSSDGGQTFQQLTAWRPAGEVGSMFPVSAVDGEDRVHVVWKGPDAHALHTASVDQGRTWSDTVPVPSLTNLGQAGPWIDVDAGVARAGALLPAGDGRLEVVLTAFPLDSDPSKNSASVVAGTAMIQLGAEPTYTDFAHLDRLPSGETLMVWAHRQMGEINVEAISVSGS